MRPPRRARSWILGVGCGASASINTKPLRSLASYGEGRGLTPVHSAFAGVHRSQRLRLGIGGRRGSAGAREAIDKRCGVHGCYDRREGAPGVPPTN